MKKEERGKERKKGRGLVGVDEGERREQGRGRKGRGKSVKRRRSTHGRKRKGSEVELGRPRKSGLEVNTRMVNRGGERRETGEREAREVNGKKWGEERGEAGAGKGSESRREGGRRVGWETRRVPNRYDYYREGNRVNRMSKVRSKSSRASEEENRG